MANYGNGKIYKVVYLLDPSLFYVGSTTTRLCKRMACHRAFSKTKMTLFYSEMRRLGVCNFKIVLIHNFPCISIEELLREEQRVISELKPCYNSIKAFATEEEKRERRIQYRIEHIEQIKKYNEDHKEQIRERKKQNNENLKKDFGCLICKKWFKTNVELKRHCRTKKHDRAVDEYWSNPNRPLL
jgi:hypothetical protein